ncbi:MAG: hypothetical protein LBE09_06115 [Christensenellaceae bacterium]|nr:hypothetical protein [Christensenellaceae bacterium]
MRQKIKETNLKDALHVERCTSKLGGLFVLGILFVFFATIVIFWNIDSYTDDVSRDLINVQIIISIIVIGIGFVMLLAFVIDSVIAHNSLNFAVFDDNIIVCRNNKKESDEPIFRIKCDTITGYKFEASYKYADGDTLHSIKHYLNHGMLILTMKEETEIKVYVSDIIKVREVLKQVIVVLEIVSER